MDSSISHMFDDMLPVHELYAQRIQLIQKYYEQYPVSQSDQIKQHTQVDNVTPQLTNIDILLGISTNPPPWALIKPPLFDPRRPFLSFSRAAPSLGTQEELAEVASHLQEEECETPQDEEYKITILKGLGILTKINDWKGYIIGRIGQFLPG